jgi:pyruvate/2-oxoglutarate dehydrogenase complex dihydrolipoamide dehydrogenase (E3) component
MLNAGVEVRLHTEVTPELAAQIKPDVLIVAVGAEPIIPQIPGIDGNNVIIANDLPNNYDKVGQKVIVLGGGLVGCETALHLAIEGRKVTVIEMMEMLCPDANQRYRPLLMAQLEKHVKCRTGMRGMQVTAKGILCTDKDGKETFLEGDTIICAAGQRPRKDTAEKLRDSAPEVIEIGDCIKASNVTQALFQGYWAGADIE